MEHSPVGSPVSEQKGEIELKTVVINEVKIQLPEDKLGDLIPIVSEETSKKENELKEQKERERFSTSCPARVKVVSDSKFLYNGFREGKGLFLDGAAIVKSSGALCLTSNSQNATLADSFLAYLDELSNVINLDMGLLVAGTKYRGEFEERFKKLIEEIKQSDGAGAAKGAIDAANILKPTLARGQLQVVKEVTGAKFDDLVHAIDTVRRGDERNTRHNRQHLLAYHRNRVREDGQESSRNDREGEVWAFGNKSKSTWRKGISARKVGNKNERVGRAS
ncbi:Chaperone protein ClpC1 chloroplastic [Cucumis melo var. makuwa]|uniref:Chaperone protein ClpC1 chloroplastic n=1 Tax=Cucumis melo var. makuwa TaxID=1194695 RepID=A0A5D3DEP3_CUCMM|nr:Chaperone protein ClpC1 chloroplastic [Cucumis melo var. makuwa]